MSEGSEGARSERVLVTGATSAVGMAVVRALRARGDAVVALVRATSRTEGLFRQGAKLVEGDVTDARTLARAAAGCTALVHAAAKTSDTGRRAEFDRVNVGGTENVLRAAREAGVARAVCLSSAAVYAGAPRGVVTERTTLRETGMAYPDSKIAAERAALACASRGGTTVTLVRPGLIYGPDDRTFVPRLLASLKRGAFAYPADPATRVSIAHVGHVVDVVLRALARPAAAGEAFNACDGEAPTLEELVTVVCRALRVPPPKLRIPGAAARAVATVLETAWDWTRPGETPPLSRYALRMLAGGHELSTDKAHALLGFAPALGSLEGITRVCEALI